MRTATATVLHLPWRTRRPLRSQAPSRIERRGTRTPRAHCVGERKVHASARAQHDAAAQPPAALHVEVRDALQSIRRLARSARRVNANAHPSGLHTSAPTRSWPIICASRCLRRAASSLRGTRCAFRAAFRDAACSRALAAAAHTARGAALGCRADPSAGADAPRSSCLSWPSLPTGKYIKGTAANGEPGLGCALGSLPPNPGPLG